MTISVVSALALAAMAMADPPARHDLDALLAKPVSPGVIALLVPHLASEGASARVIAAISDADPAVRAAAARVVYVAGLGGAASAVRDALEAETDRSAALEQLRAAALVTPPGSESALLSIASKHVVLHQLAHTSGVGMPAPASRASSG